VELLWSIRGRFLLAEVPVLALEEDERVSAAHHRVLDRADVDHVIGPLVGLADAELAVAAGAVAEADTRLGASAPDVVSEDLERALLRILLNEVDQSGVD